MLYSFFTFSDFLVLAYLNNCHLFLPQLHPPSVSVNLNYKELNLKVTSQQRFNMLPQRACSATIKQSPCNHL